MLFQGPLDRLFDEARGFGTWEEWRDFVEAMDTGQLPGEVADMGGEQKDAWYRQTWEQARAAEAKPPAAASAEAADRAFLESIRDEEGLTSFLRTLWEDAIDARGEREAAAAGQADAEEQAAFERRRQAAVQVAREAHPLVHNAAVAVGLGRPLKPSTLKAIRTLIGKAPREYRALYAAVTGDAEAVAQLEAEAAARPEIQDPRWVKVLATGSIVERVKLARQIRNEALAKKIRSGEVALGPDLEEYVAGLNEKQAEDQKRITALQKELAEYRRHTTRLERDYAEQRAELKRYQRELELVNRRIEAFLEKKEAARQAIPESLTQERERLSRQIEATRRQVARLRRQAGANTARAVAYLAKLEGVAKLRDQIRQREAERRAVRKTRERMLLLARAITRPPSAAVDIDYADRIRELARALDPKFRSKATLEKLARSRAFFEAHPEARAAVPPEVLERIEKKPLNEWTLAELEELARQVERLRSLGRLKYHLERAARRRSRAQDADQAQKTVLGGRPPRKPVGRVKKTGAWTRSMLATLRPDRIAQMLGGGIWKDLLVDRPNAAWNASQRAKNRRIEAMKKKLEELKFTLDPFDPRIRTAGYEYVGREVGIADSRYSDGRDFRDDGGKRPTLQDVLYWSIGMENERTQAALLGGNNLPEQVIKAGIASLTEREIALAAAIQADLDGNFGRLRAAMRANYNQDLAPEDHYVPMRRRDIAYESRGEEILVDFAARHGWTQAQVNKNMTKSRIDIAEHYQTPVRTDLVSLWFEAVQKEEDFIHLDAVIKDLHAVVEHIDTRRAVQQRFGPEANRWLSKYINDLAGSDLYAVSTGAERAWRTVRSNLVVAYLSFNVLSNAKQLVSVVPFLADAGPGRLAAAAGQYLAAKGRAARKGKLVGNDFIARVEELSPLVKHRSISREFEELKRLDGASTSRS